LVAVTVKVEVAPTEGVPEIAPLAESSVRPAGSAPPVTENVGAGVPDAETVKL